MDFKKIAIVFILVIFCISNCAAKELTGKIKYENTGGNHQRPFLEIYSNSKKIYSLEIHSSCGYYIKNNLLIVFESDESDYSCRFIANIYIRKISRNNIQNILYIDKLRFNYPIKSCEAEPLYNNRKDCDNVGKFILDKFTQKNKLR